MNRWLPRPRQAVSHVVGQWLFGTALDFTLRVTAS
jgi:hypothetical protein